MTRVDGMKVELTMSKCCQRNRDQGKGSDIDYKSRDHDEIKMHPLIADKLPQYGNFLLAQCTQMTHGFLHDAGNDGEYKERHPAK